MENLKKFLFEVSWEVCNKVGGIHTVIVSKVEEVIKHFGDKYILIGPWLENNQDFIEEADQKILGIKQKLDAIRLDAKVGRWNIQGKPLVVLVKFGHDVNKDKVLYELWEDFGVDSMTGGYDYVEPVLFAHNAGRAIEAISELFDDEHILAQFHEWMCGSGLLYLRKNSPHISTIFTTHATILGRSMAGNGIDIYHLPEKINADKEAQRFNVLAKHSMEKASARFADCFTTVSEITAMEAELILGCKVNCILHNGFNVHSVPDPAKDKGFYLANRKKLLDFASKFHQQEFEDENTLIISTSGRYEFHNKGIDVLIDTLGRLKQENHIPQGKKVLVYFFILAGSEEMTLETYSDFLTRYSKIATHPLWNPSNDPIINKANQYGLTEDFYEKIKLIFIPVYLNGKDKIFPLEYYEALSGCNLTIYPSFYEPWGYTPLESVAYSVPTVTTNLSGFGRWVLLEKLNKKGVYVLNRMDTTEEQLVNELYAVISSFISMSASEKAKLSKDARNTAMKAEWEHFFKNYLHAFKIAKDNANARISGISAKVYEKFEEMQFHGSESIRPRLRSFTIKALIPDKIEGLRMLAYNLIWSWMPEAHQLFNRLDPVLYEELGYNPVSLLESIDPEILIQAAENESYLQLYEDVMRKFNKYMESSQSLVKQTALITKERPVAYFSMEFGIHESLPIYSGGLGILSGDHLKSSSDLNINLVGVGLLYRKGYFKQGISKEGDQKVEYFQNDFYRMPLEEVKKRGKALIISVEFPGRTVFAKVWKANVGRIPLYLLDTDILENNPSDREITSRLYGGGKRVRIEQEIILGIGGVKILHELNINPSVYHLNEGHSAFLIIQRFINQVKYNKLDFDAAREVIRSSTVFTTHTPVPAGNETFEYKLVENYLKSYVENNGISWERILDVAGYNTEKGGEFEMTVLALKNTLRKNGVSKLHGVVSRKMWEKIWEGFLQEEVPISHITNGIHTASWLSTEMKNLFSKYQVLNLQEELLNKNYWEKINNIPDKEIWQTHMNLKSKFFEYIKEVIISTWTREGEEPSLLDQLLLNINPSQLTIGFARRFATYKRANLLFTDFERLKKIILNPRHPVQIIFAGKAHPDDVEGARLIKEIVEISKQDDFLGKVIFLEDYDIKLARKLVSGVDLWLNNPIRPYEASGTSGMKAGINGVINCSILDGWWDEGYDGTNGWAFGEKKQLKNPDTQKIFDSESLYDLLENEIIPEYYTRNNAGIPQRWIDRMKRSIITIISEYSTHRMIRDYMECLYVPAAKKFNSLIQNNFEKAYQYADWIKSIRSRFLTVHIKNISIKGSHGDSLNVGDHISVSLEVDSGKVNPEEIMAQLIIIRDTQHYSIKFSEKSGIHNENIQVINMKQQKAEGSEISFNCKYVAEKSGKFNYGIRVLPTHPDMSAPTDLNIVYWA
ncbi:MAG TPA: alpha-glucan family phosphorylase [Bacteroidia bacterium]|nr:alpha-glucan family phosphorylase [Bacteroidia bacterium]HRS58188.1 alpha-glucan family phosphorylase [Bacteroidia bacterium]HRU69269.1 alpha-glucan family phosphorylase [Bacteroidia bacterium]